MKNRHYGWWYGLAYGAFLNKRRRRGSGRARGRKKGEEEEEGEEGKRDKGKKKRKRDPYAAKQYTLNSTFAIMRVGGYVNVRETLITHTRCTIPRGCPRKSSLFFRQGNNEWTPADSRKVRPSLSHLLLLLLLIVFAQLKRETRGQGGKALRCKTRFANISDYVAKFSRGLLGRNRLP